MECVFLLVVRRDLCMRVALLRQAVFQQEVDSRLDARRPAVFDRPDQSTQSRQRRLGHLAWGKTSKSAREKETDGPGRGRGDLNPGRGRHRA